MRAISRLVILVAVLVAGGGCGGADGPKTYQVSGTVTLDDQPVKTGEILFRADDDIDKTYAGSIADGRFSFQSTAGKKRVQISAMEKVEGLQGTPGTEGDPIGPDNPADVYRDIIPEQYNANSTLEAEVRADGENAFTFDLKSSGN